MFHAFFITPDVVLRRNCSIDIPIRKARTRGVSRRKGQTSSYHGRFSLWRKSGVRTNGRSAKWVIGWRWRGAGEGYTPGGILDSLRPFTSCTSYVGAIAVNDVGQTSGERRKTRRRRVDEGTENDEKDEPLCTVYEIPCTHRSCARPRVRDLRLSYLALHSLRAINPNEFADIPRNFRR